MHALLCFKIKMILFTKNYDGVPFINISVSTVLLQDRFFVRYLSAFFKDGIH